MLLLMNMVWKFVTDYVDLRLAPEIHEVVGEDSSSNHVASSLFPKLPVYAACNCLKAHRESNVITLM